MEQQDDGLYDRGAGILRTLAHPARLQILDELRHGEACVCHLQQVMGRPQAYVSQQLRVLREAGLLDTVRDGHNIYYRIEDKQIQGVLEEVLGPVRFKRPEPACPCAESACELE